MSSLSIHKPEEGPQLATPKEAVLNELRCDGLDQPSIRVGVARRVTHNPELKDFQSVVEPMNIGVVPISPARPASSFESQTPIVNVANLEAEADNYLAAHLALDDDKLPASLVYEMDMSRDTRDSAPVHGFCTRVIQARLAAETGATASHTPDDPSWDIQIVDAKKCGEAMQDYPKHLPVLIPYSMNQEVACAMLSLLVSGGAGAYTWRFRTAGDPRGEAGMMPSYCRFRHPGGVSKILAMYNRPPEQAVLGGTAFTVESLRCLEGYYRHKRGHGYWNQAYKTIAAMGAVYLDPVASTDVLGHGFSCAHQTRTRAGVDLAKVRTWPATPAPGKVVISYPLEYPIEVPHEWLDPLANSYHEMISGKSQLADEPVKWDAQLNEVVVNMTPQNSDDDERDEGIETFPVSNADDSAVGWYRMLTVLEWIVDPQNGNSEHVVSLASRIVAQVSGRTLAERYSGMGSVTDPKGGEYCGYRNVFGFNDAALLALPRFDLYGSVCVLNLVHMPERIPVGPNCFNPDGSYNIDDAMRVYALRFHVEHILTLLRNNIWPDDLNIHVMCHQDIVQNMADGLTCHTFMTDPCREWLKASNWQLLEPMHYLRPDGRRKAYYSYDAPGSWEIDHGSVRLGAKSTSYAAVDAAMRSAWMLGGTVNAQQVGAEFVVIRDANGLIAPFAAAPYAVCNRNMRTKDTGEISISPSRYLCRGVNKTLDSVCSN